MPKTTLFIFAIALTVSSTVLAETNSADASAGAAMAKNCTGCHNSIISLEGRGSEVIRRQLNTIRSGNKIHIPNIDNLDEKDLTDIAAYLNDA